MFNKKINAQNDILISNNSQLNKTFHFFHIKKTKPSFQTSDIAPFKSQMVLKQELLEKEQQIQMLKDRAERYYQDNQFLTQQLKKKKSALFFELWSIQIFLKFMNVLQIRALVSIVLLINASLLIFLLFFSSHNHTKSDTVSHKKQKMLKHTLSLPYTIEVNAFFSIKPAQKLVIQLKHLGFRSYIGKVFEKGRAVYRVYVDEYNNLKKVHKDLKILKNKYHYKKSFVRRKF